MASINPDMNDRQLPNGRNNYAITQPTRARGLAGQTYSVLLQPGMFFRSLTALEYTRQWLWIGLVILVLVGLSAVRQASLAAGGGTPVVPDFGAPIEGDFSDDGGIAVSPLGGPPPDAGLPPDPSLGGGAASADVAGTWTTALVAASGIILGWAIQTALLAEVSLLRGFAPHLGRNLQIAIWSSVPLGLMAALQLLYYAAGGLGGQSGISGLLTEWQGYSQLPLFSQSVLLSLASRLTLFWVWSLALIYVGARRALGGSWWSSIIVVIAWVVVVVVLPVITGAIKAPEPTPVIEDMGDEFGLDGQFGESGEFLPDATEDAETGIESLDDSEATTLEGESDEFLPDATEDAEMIIESLDDSESTTLEEEALEIAPTEPPAEATAVPAKPQRGG